ncbi:hypothetical protein RI367_000971 [Sorochytrium milnesiophthora]
MTSAPFSLPRSLCILLTVLVVAAHAHFDRLARSVGNGYITAYEHVHAASTRPAFGAKDAKTVRDTFGDSAQQTYKHRWLDLQTGSRAFTLLLEPYDILHPSAKLTSLSEDGSTVISVPLTAEIYRGHVVRMVNVSSGEPLALDNARDVGALPGVFFFNTHHHARAAQRAISLDNQVELHLDNTDTPQVHGTFSVHGETFYLTDVATYSAHRRPLDVEVPPVHKRAAADAQAATDMIVYRDSNRKRITEPVDGMSVDDFRCGSDDLPHRNFRPTADITTSPLANSSVMSSNHTFESEPITSGCPASQMAVYVGAVLDCNYIARYSTASAASSHALSVFASVSNIYQTQFNVQVGLIEMISMATCWQSAPPPLSANQITDASFNRVCSANYTISNRLNDLSYWRGQYKNANANANVGSWISMSTCNTGATIGLAWLNQVCVANSFAQYDSQSQSNDYVSGTAVMGAPTSIGSDSEWLIVAHELGHNFGAVHDCVSSSTCDNSGNCCSCTTSSCNTCATTYMMNPYSSSTVTQFSPCSTAQICNLYNTNAAPCAQTPGSQQTLGGQTCGNGIVEGNEQCDCGGTANCAQDQCCNTDCTLKTHAQCDDASDSCCSGCQIVAASANKVCRTPQSGCDLGSTCNGQSKACPASTFRTNGTTCYFTVNGANNTGVCASGQCTTRDYQCQQAGGTGQCPTYYSGQCALVCNTQSGSCQQFNGHYVDGTPCSTSGICVGGTCSQADTTSAAAVWIINNPTSAIVIFVAVAVLVIAGLWQLCRLRGRRQRFNVVPQSTTTATTTTTTPQMAKTKA